MDFFAGSGTTGHACLDLNKDDEGQRKYIQVELGDYFYTTILPRIKKVMYSQEWKDGEPQDSEGYSHFFKYQSLEQYEDSLDNIRFAEEKEELNLFNKYDDYLINYMLDYETRDSLLDLDKFSNPFNYYLEIIEDKEKVKKKVDLVETFNYLIGLEVKQKNIYNHQERKFKVIFGEKNNKEIAVIWRNTEDLNFEQERKFIEDEIISDKKIDKLYLNGDNYLENSFLIEDQFNKLMF
jgi:adenine-specific DNA-methyltransferase